MLPGEPSPEAVKRLSAATLALQDLPDGVTVGEEGQKSKSGAASYFRGFNVAGRPIFGSDFMTLTAESRLSKSESAASASMAVFASPRGRQQVLTVFVRAAKIPAAHKSVAPLTGLPAGLVGSVLKLKTAKGPYVAYLVSIRAGKLVETLAAFGQASEMNAASIKAVAVKARARLNDTL